MINRWLGPAARSHTDCIVCRMQCMFRSGIWLLNTWVLLQLEKVVRCKKCLWIKHFCQALVFFSICFLYCPCWGEPFVVQYWKDKKLRRRGTVGRSIFVATGITGGYVLRKYRTFLQKYRYIYVYIYVQNIQAADHLLRTKNILYGCDYVLRGWVCV